jgi:hypothetical protein
MQAERPSPAAQPLAVRVCPMSPMWIWMQVAICVFVVIGMVIAIVRLA